MNIFYWLGGSKDRKPRSQFWGPGGFNEVDPQHDVPDERMHMTVRILTDLDALQTCSSLGGIQPSDLSGNGGPWVWNLRRTLCAAQMYEVHEGLFSRMERRLLSDWLDTELENLGREAGPNDPTPATLIPDLQAWLWTPGQIPE